MILEILKKYSGSEESHHLSQKRIIELLKQEYGVECDRRSVKANMEALNDMISEDWDYEIKIPGPEDPEKGYYLISRPFEDADLRLLIDAVLFSNHLTEAQAKELIGKLKKLSNKYFEAKVSHISNLPELHHGDNTDMMYSLNEINDAISAGRKIRFIYNVYGTDLKLHPKRQEYYIVSPYQMVANHGHYYLIGNYEGHDDISHYRVDRMTGVEILPDQPVRNNHSVKGMENGLNLPKHMAEHIYMYGGDSVDVLLKSDKNMIGELIDWFGKDFKIYSEDGDSIEVSLYVNENAMYYWAIQYGAHVEVLKPLRLRKRIAEAVRDMNARYNGFQFKQADTHE